MPTWHLKSVVPLPTLVPKWHYKQKEAEKLFITCTEHILYIVLYPTMVQARSVADMRKNNAQIANNNYFDSLLHINTYQKINKCNSITSKIISFYILHLILRLWPSNFICNNNTKYKFDNRW